MGQSLCPKSNLYRLFAAIHKIHVKTIRTYYLVRIVLTLFVDN